MSFKTEDRQKAYEVLRNRPPVARLRKLIEEMQALMSELSKYGATDSEPDGVFQYAMVKAARDGEKVIPKSADGWELYTSSMKCGTAGRRLSAQCRKVVDYILNCKVADARYIREYLEDYCWRCCW